MTVEALAAWMLAIMLTSVPPGNSRKPKEARETAEQGKARYGAIAKALAKVALDSEEAPLFSGKNGRLKTATLMLAMSRYESTWRRDVDLGIGPKARGAGGRYWCLMQIAVPKGKTPEGWTGRDLVENRQRCFRRALHILQRGKRVCRKHGGTSFVNHYASGRCDRAKKPVKKRIDLMNKWLREHPFPEKKKKKKEAEEVMTKPLVACWFALALLGCRDPVAPMVPNCSDSYRPAMCLDGDEVCETDDKGCRICICERDEPANPAE